MHAEFLTHEAIRGLLLTLYISAPILIAVTAVGLLVGLFQALTSIQEQTLPHSFKFFAAVVVITLSANWGGGELVQYINNIFLLIPKL